VIGRSAGCGVHAHSDKPAKQEIAGEPGGARTWDSLVNCTICGSYPSFWKVMEISALRLATTAHGVVQVVGTSSPLTMASAPDGVDAMLMFSVVPRVTDAQPLSMTPSVTIPRIRMKMSPVRYAINRNQRARAIGD